MWKSRIEITQRIKNTAYKKNRNFKKLKKTPQQNNNFFFKKHPKKANKNKKEIPIKKTRKERNITKTPKTLIWYFVHIKKRAKKYKRELKKSSSNN